MELPVHLNDIRLVATLRDEDEGTGKTREIKDVVVRHMYAGDTVVEREHGDPKPEHKRYLAGEDLEIPWPESRLADFQAEDSDTLRMMVEERTYLPSVLNPPFPQSIIDELRNPYNLQRTRHDTEWIEKKLEADAREAWMKRRRLLTPQAEYWAEKVKKKEQAGKPEITSETLELIRETQALNLRGKRLKAEA